MRFMNIASGSSGNATYIGTVGTHILIDTGISRKRIEQGLERSGLKLSDISAILITHEHSDHICSLAAILKKYDIPLYLTKGTYNAIHKGLGNGTAFANINIISAGTSFKVGDIEIKAINISHDAIEPVCYRLDAAGASCAIVTDLGAFDGEIINSLKGLNALMVESNHDKRMLETGPYPYRLKLRISGSHGHLSNDDTGLLLKEIINKNLRYIALGHLSRQNNLAEIAKMNIEDVLAGISEELKAEEIIIDVADQHLGSRIIDF